MTDSWVFLLETQSMQSLSRDNQNQFTNPDPKNPLKRIGSSGKRGMITVDEQDEFDNNSELQGNIKVG